MCINIYVCVYVERDRLFQGFGSPPGGLAGLTSAGQLVGWEFRGGLLLQPLVRIPQGSSLETLAAVHVAAVHGRIPSPAGNCTLALQPPSWMRPTLSSTIAFKSADGGGHCIFPGPHSSSRPGLQLHPRPGWAELS